MTIDELRLIVGSNLRRRRIECDLSQRALGDAVGLSNAQINRIEKGICSTPVDLLAKLSIPLDTEPLFFLTPSSNSGNLPSKKNLVATA